MRRLRTLTAILLIAMLLVSAQSGQAATSYIDKVLAVAPENLLVYFPLNEVTGTTAYDISGNNLNGGYYSTTLAGAVGPGGYGNAPTFDGINDYILLSMSAITNYRDHGTVSVWILPSDFSGSVYPFLFASDDSSYWLYIALFDDLAFLARDGSGTIVTYAPVPTSGGWIHLAGTWQAGGDLTLYINGVQSGTPKHSIPTASLSELSATKQTIGSYTTNPNGPFSGNIAHFAIWNVPLDATQIASLANPNGLAATATVPSVSAYSTLPASGQAVRFDYTGSFGEIAIVVALLVIIGLMTIFGMWALTQRKA